MTPLTVRRTRVLLCVAILLVAACGSTDDRPTDTAWRTAWESTRDLVPDAAALIEGGEDLCGELVGELRTRRREILPTPTPALDDAVHAWISDAEAITFDCPADAPAELAERLHQLDVRSAAVDAGLAADSAG